MPSFFRPRSRQALLVFAVALAVLLDGTKAMACGPCTFPEVWGVRMLGDRPFVVTNFGLLSPSDTGFQFVCEEAIGGLLLDAQADEAEAFAFTGSGLFAQAGGACNWDARPATQDDGAVVGFSLATVQSGQVPAKFALVVDSDTQEIDVLAAAGDEDFSVLHTFDSSSGYRDIVAGGDPPAVFVAGYAYDPRTFKLAYSLDGGATFDEVTPQVNNDEDTLTARLVDPAFPHALLIQAGVPGAAHEIWRFDGDTAEIERILSLEDGEVYGGMALSDNSLWVAGRRTGGGSLYRADREQLEFTRVLDSGPEFVCLAAQAGVLYACVNDFTYASDFVVGTSTDEGTSWTPFLTVADLGKASSCGAKCSTTDDWLVTTFGSTEPSAEPAAAGAGPEAAAGAGPEAAAGAGPDDSAGLPETNGGCQCALYPTGASGASGWMGALIFSLLFRRGHRHRARPKRDRQRSARST